MAKVFNGTIAKIFVTLYQILSPMASNLGITFPPLVTEALLSFGFLSLDIVPSLNLACIYEVSYQEKLCFYTLWPVVASLICWECFL